MSGIDPEDAFLCAKHTVATLMAKLVALRAAAESAKTPTLRTTLSRALALYVCHLEALHGAVRAFLLGLHQGGPAGAETSSGALLARLSELADEVPGLEALEQGRPADLAALVRQQRAAKLEGDERALRAAAAALPPAVPAQPDALAAVVRHLAQREQSLSFHVGPKPLLCLVAHRLATARPERAERAVFGCRLAAEVAERFGAAPPRNGGTAGRTNGDRQAASGRTAGGGDGGASASASGEAVLPHSMPYSMDNFSYGSTPYASWLQVLEAAGSAVRDAMAAPGREYVVWGSSCGWLVLYGALTYGWRSRGVELLSCLHRCAEGAAEAQAGALAGTAGVRLVCCDLLHDTVRGAGLVLLADQCWDAQLAAAAAAKLARELPAGALCVSYTGDALAGFGASGVSARVPQVEKIGGPGIALLGPEGGALFWGTTAASVRHSILWRDGGL
ncbi:hypothetical protein TSOC_003722 [Tetrabaena socialis]|uniref:Uncharacterized protein n=1 Tax=Tetrabaena socialis TaxID=47790 RepID=A0A2J8AAU4_9CHLO|nr:hypothetical protein TSOC_003722 [Tetrabaena socialis]|eukprot:PNH09640.1 hypothetical protein TSOC_003722 [Tetrabaena socialis]